MDADTELQPAVIGKGFIRQREPILYGGGALHRVHSTCKLRKDAVAGRVGNPPPMLSDQELHDLAMSHQHPKGFNLVLAH